MIPAITLVSLACAIANHGPIDTSALEAQINAQDGAKIQAIIDSGMCLPENMEKLLLESKTRTESGDLKAETVFIHTAPSEACS